MTDQPNPNTGTGAGADETYTWTNEPAGSTGSTQSGGSAESTGSTESMGSTGGTGSTGAEGSGDAGPSGQSWDAGAGTKDESVSGTAGAAAVQVLEQLRDAIDDLAEKASPTVREYSARIAELAAFAADKTAPFLKRAGEATAEASGKLAERSRTWAADLRTSQGGTGAAGATATSEAEAPPAASTDTGGPEGSTAQGSDTVAPSWEDAAAPDEHGTGLG
jgi:hypothetical protein